MLIRAELLPKQVAFVRDDSTRELLYSGCYGGGKSRALCYKIIKRASVPGAREGLCRLTLVSLKATTLKTLLEPDGNLPPVLPPGTYTHNKSDREIKIAGGGTIYYFGLDTPDKHGSLNLTGCAVDEVVDLNEDAYTMLVSRIRMVLPGLSNQLYGACNPGPPSHFLAHRFGITGESGPQPETGVIHTSAHDNWFLRTRNPGYYRSLMRFTGVRYERYVEGRWVGSDGLVYFEFDRAVHVKIVHNDKGDRNIVGVDDGVRNPFAALKIHIDGDTRLHVDRCKYETGWIESQKVEAIRKLCDKHTEAVIVDPGGGGKSLCEALKREGLPAIVASKGADSVVEGVAKVQDRLKIEVDGRPRLTVDASCRDVIKEFESYEYDKKRDQPTKANDHALDALRYVVMHLDANEPAYIELADDGDAGFEDDDWGSM